VGRPTGGRLLIARRPIERERQSHHGHETRDDPSEPAAALTPARVVDHPKSNVWQRSH
jgi:hypothetical protein